MRRLVEVVPDRRQDKESRTLLLYCTLLFVQQSDLYKNALRNQSNGLANNLTHTLLPIFSSETSLWFLLTDGSHILV
ncbi:hypothetical protein EWB00_010691 [Schistosoma japonicum]|uniref:Uncharacterized protein n=1 Tax=Schistosoma japonicum TaxID=6182 RepID=A0A4Z2DNC3_SCHJA|nr:hypothetical protein EWB00_010691 [Schistosoma japonicum]